MGFRFRGPIMGARGPRVPLLWGLGALLWGLGIGFRVPYYGV